MVRSNKYKVDDYRLGKYVRVWSKKDTPYSSIGYPYGIVGGEFYKITSIVVKMDANEHGFLVGIDSGTYGPDWFYPVIFEPNKALTILYG